MGQALSHPHPDLLCRFWCAERFPAPLGSCQKSRVSSQVARQGRQAQSNIPGFLRQPVENLGKSSEARPSSDGVPGHI
ncbi:hypothetical protein CYB_1542 [Synechococcus sp. JA-2-3B'a(2-13)]|nr:hypothetical protein CYB_1542 [Synechococcus sp. JA-2-3B'a(2-13)]